MDDALRIKWLTELAQRLQKIVEQDLRLKTVLYHELMAEGQSPLPSLNKIHYEQDCPLLGTWVGASGKRFQFIIPATLNLEDQNQPRVAPFPNEETGAGQNFVFIFNNASKTKLTANHLQHEFLEIIDQADTLVESLAEKLCTDLGLWNMWQDSRFLQRRGRWLDFVFELAWRGIPGLPLKTIKAIYCEGEKYLINNRHHERFDASFVGFAGCDVPNYKSPEIVQPIRYWQSDLVDLVSASRYAMDFLVEWLKGNFGKPQAPFLVTKSMLDTFYGHVIKTQSLLKTDKINWPDSLPHKNGAEKKWDYGLVRLAIEGSQYVKRDLILVYMPTSPEKAEEEYQKLSSAKI